MERGEGNREEASGRDVEWEEKGEKGKGRGGKWGRERERVR